jgi:cell shape-determining protein MreC
MTDHTIADLRRRLFETIDGVRDGSIDIDKAKLVGDLSQVIVNTAKVEVEYLRTTGGGESTFIDTAIGADNLPNGITAITRHTLKG